MEDHHGVSTGRSQKALLDLLSVLDQSRRSFFRHCCGCRESHQYRTQCLVSLLLRLTKGGTETDLALVLLGRKRFQEFQWSSRGRTETTVSLLEPQ